MKDDVAALNKILNSVLFLDNYPMINRVWVEEYGTNKIDIVLSVKEPANEYWPVRDEVKKSIHNLAKMAGVKTRFNIYP